VSLHFSIRILPHKQNSGGFFVAVLHKKYSLRDAQNSSKLSSTLHNSASDKSAAITIEPVDTQTVPALLDHTSEPASDEKITVTSEPVVTQAVSAGLDHTSSVSEPSTQNCSIVPDSGTSQQPVSDNATHSGWSNLLHRITAEK